MEGFRIVIGGGTMSEEGVRQSAINAINAIKDQIQAHVRQRNVDTALAALAEQTRARNTEAAQSLGEQMKPMEGLNLHHAAAWPFPNQTFMKPEPVMPTIVGALKFDGGTAGANKVVSQPASVLFTHVRVETDDGDVNPKGGVTVAYAPAPYGGKEPGNIYEVSTAVCSPADVYDKAKGRKIALANFEAGKRINVRVPNDMTPASYLQGMFYSCED